jgi:signal peptidase I
VSFADMDKKYSRLLREIAETIILTALVFLILITFVVQGYKVYGSCMEPNLYTGERLLGNKFVYRFERPGRGDVVVFKYPPDPKKVFIKRIIGVPGDTVMMRGGKLFVNSVVQDEHQYVKTIPHGSFGPRTVSKGHVFVLGDNRDESNDSRFWGELPVQNIQAKAWLRYWPVSRLAAFR